MGPGFDFDDFGFMQPDGDEAAQLRHHWPDLAALAPMGDRARVAIAIGPLVAQAAAAARAGDHIVCMSNGGFGGVHDKLLAALRATSTS